MARNDNLEEIYAARQAFLAKHDDDVHAYVEAARKRALESGRPIAASKQRTRDCNSFSLRKIVTNLRMLILVAFCLLGTSYCLAEDKPQRFEKGFAVVDIALVFKCCDDFKDRMATMKDDVSEFEDELRPLGAKIRKLQEQLDSFEAGSSQYQEVFAEITSLQEDGKQNAAKRKKEFLRLESDIYAEVYKSTVMHIRDIAKERGIVLVVRHNSEAMDESDRKNVLEHVNKAVVFQDNIDITADVILRLNKELPFAAADIENGKLGSNRHRASAAR